MKNINNLYNIVSEHRKNLSKLAESGFEEFKTSSYIKNVLQRLSINYDIYLQTAVCGIIKGKNPKKIIAFRSDIDALPTENGCKHVCGHDGHMSILLTFLEYIVTNKEKLNDNIVFIFQPAEEGPGGAKPLIEEGIIKKYNIDEIYGIHMYPEIESGYFGIKDSYFMAQVTEFDIVVNSKSGHGAMPQNSIDGITIASEIINSFQTIISRNISPIDSGVLTIGKVCGGTRRNIIADKVVLEGTIRSFEDNVFNIIKDRFFKICNGIEIMYNCKLDIRFEVIYPCVNNDVSLGKMLREVIGNKVVELPKLMISEDFSFYQKHVPGYFIMLGCRDEEKGFINGLHHIDFNFDEKVLLNGINLYLNILEYYRSMD